MNHFKFNEWYANNFNSWEQLKFKVTPGKHLITGMNGAGKSSIFEPLPWTFYKYASKDKDPSFLGQGNCSTGVEFQKNNELYKIDRYFRDEKYDDKVKIYLNGEDVSLRKNSGTQKELPSIIEISSDLFISTIVVLQGLPINFTTLTPVIRKSIIESMVGFSVWNRYTNLIRSYAREKTLANNTIQSTYNAKREEMISLNSKVETTKSLTPVSDDEIKSIKQQMLKVIQDIEALKADKQKISTSSSIELERNLKELNKSCGTIENKISNLSNVITNKICPTCTQQFPEEKISTAEKELKFLEPKYVKLKQSIGELEATLKSINEVTTKINNSERDRDNFQNQIISLLNKRSAAAEDVKALTAKLEELVLEVNSIKSEGDALNNIISGADYLSSLLLPSSKFRAKILSSYLDRINSIIQSVCPLIFPNLTFKLVLDPKESGIEINVTKNGHPWTYKKLSGGQKKRMDVITILSFQKFLLENSGISTNLLVFDEIFDSLDVNGVNDILNSLDTLFGPDVAIYIITHNQNMKSMFNSVITVEMTDEKSYFKCS